VPGIAAKWSGRGSASNSHSARIAYHGTNPSSTTVSRSNGNCVPDMLSITHYVFSRLHLFPHSCLRTSGPSRSILRSILRSSDVKGWVQYLLIVRALVTA
jgi:hypothetical protein